MGKRRQKGFNDDAIDDDISTDDENRENSSNNQANICTKQCEFLTIVADRPEYGQYSKFL